MFETENEKLKMIKNQLPLESIIQKACIEENNSSVKSTYYHCTNYLVDVSAAWIFYAPTFATTEYFIAGMSGDKVAKSRLMAAGVQAIIMRPYALFREWWAKYWNAGPKSSQLKKFLVDSTATSIFQIPLYSSMLYLNNCSFEEGIKALSVGIAMGAASGRPYGFWLDKWRKLCGKKPTLSK